MNKRYNCFNFIRLLAALKVFYGHSFEHFELQAPDIFTKLLNGFQAVPIFFILSGFLLWDSIPRSGNFASYAKKRIFRLYPELWCGVILNSIIMLILYRENIETVPFIAFNITQSTIFQFWTPDCLRGYGVGTPNGSLWTIGIMVQCYIVLYFCFRLLHKKRIKSWCVFIVVFVGINVLFPLTKELLPEIVYKLATQTFFPHFWLFLFGALINEYFDELITWLKKWWLVFLLAAIGIAFAEFDIGYYKTAKCIFLGLAIIGFGYSYPKIKISTDVSYEIYIIHMIVINAMIHLGYSGKIIDACIAFIITLLCALAFNRSIGTWSLKKKSSVS